MNVIDALDNLFTRPRIRNPLRTRGGGQRRPTHPCPYQTHWCEALGMCIPIIQPCPGPPDLSARLGYAPKKGSGLALAQQSQRAAPPPPGKCYQTPDGRFCCPTAEGECCKKPDGPWICSLGAPMMNPQPTPPAPGSGSVAPVPFGRPSAAGVFCWDDNYCPAPYVCKNFQCVPPPITTPPQPGAGAHAARTMRALGR